MPTLHTPKIPSRAGTPLRPAYLDILHVHMESVRAYSPIFSRKLSAAARNTQPRDLNLGSGKVENAGGDTQTPAIRKSPARGRRALRIVSTPAGMIGAPLLAKVRQGL